MFFSLKTMVKPNWFVCICISWPLAIATFNWTIRDDTSRLSEVTSIIAREYLSKLTSTIVILESNSEPKKTILNIRLLENLLLNVQGRVTVQLSFISYNVKPYEYYILIVDSFEAFTRLYSRLFINFYDSQLHYLIILTTYSWTYLFHIMRRIFQLCHSVNIVNANIIIDDPTLGVCMFTYFLYSADECETFRPVLIFKFNQGFENLKTVFPQKLNDFHGCPMSVAARIVPPMLDFKGNISNPEPVGRWENLSGFEGVLLKAIAESLNFTIQLIFPSNEREHVFALINHNAELAIGGFSGSNENRVVMSQSIVYHTTPYVFIVREGQLKGSLARLAAPFKIHVWILIALVLFSGIIIIQVLRRMKTSIRRFVFGNDNDTPVGNFFAAFLGYTIPRTPQRNFARYLLMLWLILTLVIRNAYQGSLYDAIRTNKFVNTPSSFNDLIKWKYKMLLPPELKFSYLDLFPRNETRIVYASDVKRLQMVEESGAGLTTFTLRDTYMYYMALTYWNGSDLTMINEVVYMYQVVMFFPQHSIYMDVFNKKLRAFLYSGIVTHFHTKFNKEPSVFWKDPQQPPKRALTNSRIDAIYKIYASMTVLALAVFSLELLSKYSAKLRRIIEILN